MLGKQETDQIADFSVHSYARKFSCSIAYYFLRVFLI